MFIAWTATCFRKYHMILLKDLFSISDAFYLPSKLCNSFDIKTKTEAHFVFRNHFSLSFQAEKQLVASTFLLVLDCGDIIYKHSSAKSLHLQSLSWNVKIPLKSQIINSLQSSLSFTGVSSTTIARLLGHC